MAQFPDLIEWMDDMSMKELHKLHEEENPSLDFSFFVKREYEAHKQTWHDEMNIRRLLKYDMNEDNNIIIETAKSILVAIVNNSIKDGNVKKIVTVEDLTPDYRCDAEVVDIFFSKIIPAVDKMLTNMK